MIQDTYSAHVNRLEKNLAGYAKHSFSANEGEDRFVDGGEFERYYEDQWKVPQEKPRYFNRTPLQIERDRILYSNSVRKLTEKYHILYHGSKRIVRNYTTHTMRMAQVSRALCRGLGLNEDFAEAIALGTKLGSLPFLHISKDEVSEWVRSKVNDISSRAKDHDRDHKKGGQRRIWVEDGGVQKIPTWLDEITSKDTATEVKRYIPLASGNEHDTPYSSGMQGYWTLSTNPYALESIPNYFSPHTLYGIWKHSLDTEIQHTNFQHDFKFDDVNKAEHHLDATNITLESIVVQYADDITWVVENLNDANQAALINDPKAGNIYDQLHAHIGKLKRSDPRFRGLVKEKNPGLLYTYFIHDFIETSTATLEAHHIDRAQPVRAFDLIKKGIVIGLSAEGLHSLGVLKEFLKSSVFSVPRVSNRNTLLRTISRATMDILYANQHNILETMIDRKALLENWDPEATDKAKGLITNDVHRIQLAVNIFSDMGDHQIFEFLDVPNF